jgi:integrase/recombinase XerD
MFNQFINELKYLKNVSPLTIKSYRQAYDRYKRCNGENDILPTKQSLNQFVIRMREAGLKPTTCNISIRAMNSYLRWLYENEIVKDRLKIKQLKTERKVIEPYTDEEIQAVLRFKPKDFYEWRLYALACLLIDTGCRIEEVLTLRTNGLDLDNQLLRIKGKGNKERIVPFSFELRRLLFLYLKKRFSKRGDYVFCATTGNRLSYRNVLRDWKRLCHKLNIPYRPFHQLRHNFGLNFIREGGDISELRRLLGHSSITTTQLYVNLQTEDLKRAHSKTSILSRLR